MVNTRKGLQKLMVVFFLVGCQTMPAQMTAQPPTVELVSSPNMITDRILRADAQIPDQQQNLPSVTPTAQPVQSVDLAYGDTVEVDTSGGAVQVNFTLDEPQIVNIIGRGAGTTDPRIFLFAADERPLTLSDDHNALRDDLDDFDAYIEDAFLLAGTYNLRVEGAGVGKVLVTVEQGDMGKMGQLTIIQQRLNESERYTQPITLNAGEVISIIAFKQTGNLDTRLNLRNAAGERLARNDDSEGFDPLLNPNDAKIEYFIAPEAGVYNVEVRGFNPSESGDFLFIVMRYGTLQPVAEPIIEFSGTVLPQQRISYQVDFEAGEVITVTGRAVNSPVDPQVRLLDPNNIIVMGNDDHETDATDIAEFDARFSDYITQVSGAYTLDFESLSGRGAYHLLIERYGKIDPDVIGEPIDADLGVVFIPGDDASEVSPEATAEVGQ